MVLIIIIYLAFVSLGLPDSILGTAWPLMRAEWMLPIDQGGYVSFLIIGSTILSSFLSGHVIKRFGTAKVTFFSCTMTGLALLGFSFAPSYYWLLPLAIPLGLGGGAVDAALNHYVASHYQAHHMNWLHSFWGVGATLGPIIMSVFLTTSWRYGYRTISILQLSLAVVLLLTLRLWPKETFEDVEHTKNNQKVIHVKGVKYALMIFMFYCMVEFSTGLWGSSYLVSQKNLAPEMAARFVALFYGGITVGRVVAGFLSFKFTNKQMIVGGITIALVSILLFLLPLPSMMYGVLFLSLGLGLAPIFPSMIHETPVHFGKEMSQKIIGYQMGFGGIGSAFLPPLIGILVRNTSMAVFPYILFGGLVILAFCFSRILHLKKVS